MPETDTVTVPVEAVGDAGAPPRELARRRPVTGRRLVTLGIAAAVALLLPAVVDARVWQVVMVLVVTDAIIVLGLSLLFGFAGQISLAQSAFAGIGAYAVAISNTRWGWSPWLGLPLGLLLSGLIAYLVGRPVLRLHGLYLAMATIALNTIFVIVAGEMREYTGGPYGLAGLEPLSVFGHEIYEAVDMYYVALAFFAVLGLVAALILRSRLGRQLEAIRDNERAAGLSGIDVPRIKVTVFVISAMFASVGGFLKAEYLLLVTPGQFSIVSSIYVVVMLVVGGATSIWGVILGAAFINALPEALDASETVEPILFAAAFMLVLMFLPDGLAPAIGRVWRRVVALGRRS